MNIGQRAARGTLWLGASSWINRLMTAGVIAVLAGRLQPRELGLLSIAVLASGTLIIFNSFGFADAVVYEPDRPREAAETSLLVSGAISLTLASLLFLGAPVIAGFFAVPDAVSLLRFYSLAVVADGLSQTPKGLLTRDLQFARRFLVETLPGIVGSGLTIGLAIGGAGVWSLAIGDATRAILGLAVSFLVLPHGLRPRWHGDMARKMWPFARAVLAMLALDFALQNVDYALVGRLLGPVALGFYTLAFRVAILPFVTVTYVVAGVAFPTLARLKDDPTRLRATFRTMIRVTTAATFLLGAGLVALAPFLELLGTRWSPAVSTARALGVYVCLRSAAHLVTPLLQGTGRPGAVAWLRLTWVGLLVSLIPLFARHGILAVGLVQVVVAAVLLIAHGVTARRLLGIEGFARDLLPAGTAAVTASAVVTVLHRLTPETSQRSFVALVVLAVVLCAVYVTVLLLFRPALRQEMRSLRALDGEGIMDEPDLLPAAGVGHG